MHVTTATMILAHGNMDAHDMIMFSAAVTVALGLPIAALIFVLVKRRADGTGPESEEQAPGTSPGLAAPAVPGEPTPEQARVDGPAERDRAFIESMHGWEKK